MFAKGKKVFAVFLSAVMLVSAFTACSESSGNSSSSDNTSSFAETYVYNSVSVNPLGREGEDGTINLKVWGPDAAQESLREQCDEFCQIMKEYGADHVYYRLSDIAAGKPEGDTFYLTFFDDILATGGTACGIAEALNREVIHLDGKEYKVRVKEFLFIVEFPDLYNHDLINSIAPVHSFIKIHGE